MAKRDTLDLPYYTIELDSQVVDLVVNDAAAYHSQMADGERLIIGNELFSYLCSNCHPHNKIFDTTGFYEKEYKLDDVLLPAAKNHGNWPERVILNLDSFDVLTIQYYINRYQRDDVRGAQ